tara:strand:+ start:465 stop:917 length:453 start_codon:yes stop_codon:yes gene_type:complete
MKRIFILILITFVYGCGYTSLYKEMKDDLKINVVSMKGDFEINNFIKNNLRISSKKNSLNIHNITFETKYKKITLAKNATGEATDYNLEMSVKFIITSSNNKQLEFKESFKIKKNNDNFEQSNYEKEIKRNFSEIVGEKLIINLKKISDS